VLIELTKIFVENHSAEAQIFCREFCGSWKHCIVHY